VPSTLRTSSGDSFGQAHRRPDERADLGRRVPDPVPPQRVGALRRASARRMWEFTPRAAPTRVGYAHRRPLWAASSRSRCRATRRGTTATLLTVTVTLHATGTLGRRSRRSCTVLATTPGRSPSSPLTNVPPVRVAR
jgi:hypothetical protein